MRRATALKHIAIWSLLCLVLVVQPLPGRAADPQPPKPAAPAPTSAVIPVAELATRAAQVPSLIRTLIEPVTPNAEIESIRERLPELRKQMDLELVAAETISGMTFPFPQRDVRLVHDAPDPAFERRR
jgi:hypothetical protein